MIYVHYIFLYIHYIQQRKDNPSGKQIKDSNRQFVKESNQMANKHIKRCSTSLVIKEMEIKITM